MTKVTLDANTLTKFDGVRDYAVVCNEAGQTIGYFCPTIEPPRGPDGKIISPISDEEWERRRQEKGGRSLKEILADLNKL